jgi:ferrous iron transport protein B
MSSERPASFFAARLKGDCADCPANMMRLGIDTSGFDHVVALAGNPNTGKSTVFNALTGLRQHVGNWPGKTVTRAEGGFSVGGNRYKLVDLPGTYSLLSASTDEEIARDFILFGRPDCTVVVVDATMLERNLNLVLQVLEVTDRVVLCLNLVDEARRKGIRVDADGLSRELGIPVVPTVARTGSGMTDLIDAVRDVANGKTQPTPRRVPLEGKLRTAVDMLTETLGEGVPNLPNARWVAMRLLEGDPRINESLASGEIYELGAETQTEPNTGTRLPAGDGATVAVQGAGQAPSGALVATAPPAPSATPERQAFEKKLLSTAERLRAGMASDFRDDIVQAVYTDARRITDHVVKQSSPAGRTWDAALDRVLTSRIFGLPIMFLGLAVVFWLTIVGANVPSQMIANGLFAIEAWISGVFASLGSPEWLTGFLWHGVYRGMAWVIAVMLPPMAIFFPLFTILENLGYLPRVAFNMDRLFKKVGGHGKQALTMSMGFGCNAAGVIAARVIDSPRERLIAILTNNFVPCNGRFPTLIMLATIFVAASFPPVLASIAAAGAVVGVVFVGIVFTFLVSWGLSKTVLKGEASSFTLELTPYRRPNFGQILYTSLIDRTLFVLYRAVVMAAPAGAVIWMLSNIHVGGESLATSISAFLDAPGHVMGLDGAILLAYIIAIPANEIVVPTLLMTYTGAGAMFEFDSMSQLQSLLVGQEHWTLLTAVCLMLFSVLHNPCSTTIWTIYKETRSAKWTTLGALMPLVIAIVVTIAVASIVRLLG